VKIVCTSCRSEGLPGVIGARPPYHDPRDTAGICWRHKLETLKRAQERGVTFADPRVRFLIIVARHAGDIFAQVSERFLDDPRVQILQDRRRGERRKWKAPYPTDRRKQDRRRARDYVEDRRDDPVVIVPTLKALDTHPAPLSPEPATSEVTAMENNETAAQAWHNFESWARDSQHMLTRVLPLMVQESEELRRRTDSAEDQAARLKREVDDLQNEIARLGKEINRLTAERAVTTEVVQRGISEIARLAGDVLAALKER
jgi:hypothetical protein